MVYTALKHLLLANNLLFKFWRGLRVQFFRWKARLRVKASYIGDAFIRIDVILAEEGGGEGEAGVVELQCEWAVVEGIEEGEIGVDFVPTHSYNMI
jgi:hypothetical protein